MADFKNTQSPTKTTPSHIAYHVRERENAEPVWTRVGCAWTNRDGKGFNLQLDCLPIDGRLTLRVASEKKS